MLDKLFKISVIVIAGFIVILSVILLSTNLFLNAQLKPNSTSASSGFGIPESHSWEITIASDGTRGYLFNKVTGSTFYLNYDKQPTMIK